jgi:hypothetical protein
VQEFRFTTSNYDADEGIGIRVQPQHDNRCQRLLSKASQLANGLPNKRDQLIRNIEARLADMDATGGTCRS